MHTNHDQQGVLSPVGDSPAGGVTSEQRKVDTRTESKKICLWKVSFLAGFKERVDPNPPLRTPNGGQPTSVGAPSVLIDRWLPSVHRCWASCAAYAAHLATSLPRVCVRNTLRRSRKGRVWAEDTTPSGGNNGVSGQRWRLVSFFDRRTGGRTAKPLRKVTDFHPGGPTQHFQVCFTPTKCCPNLRGNRRPPRTGRSNVTTKGQRANLVDGEI